MRPAVRSFVADKIKSVEAGAQQSVSLAMSAKDKEEENDLGAVISQELEVEITDDAPTEAERKAIEDFFDWLFAEALRSTGEVDEAA